MEQSPSSTRSKTVKKSVPIRIPRMINTESAFKPEGPDSYDFTEDQLRSISSTAIKPRAIIRVNQPHEWDHLTEACGCLFNDDQSQRITACDKLILQNRFIKSDIERLPYTAMDKLLKIAEALDARQYLYPKDEQQKAQLLSLWGFAYEVTTSAIADLTQDIAPNY